MCATLKRALHSSVHSVVTFRERKLVRRTTPAAVALRAVHDHSLRRVARRVPSDIASTRRVPLWTFGYLRAIGEAEGLRVLPHRPLRSPAASSGLHLTAFGIPRHGRTRRGLTCPHRLRSR